MKTVCGLDVHKDNAFLCIMRDLMLSEGVAECAMESTSIYWIPVGHVIEGHVGPHLANPYFIKQLLGKKSDSGTRKGCAPDRP